jgi:predicted alpha/beta-hydrolase family hydrolase
LATVLRSGTGTTSGLVFIYAPGAGSNINDPFGAFLAAELPGHAIECWRFQFPYMEAKRSGPDRPPVLEAAWREVIEQARGAGKRVVVGGRSMGGRIASQVVAQGVEVAGLALFAYPLHAPGRPEQPRSEHLHHIAVPTLFCSGTRDAYGTPAELEAAARLVPGARLHFLEGADHGFAVLKASGRTREDAWAEATKALLNFLDSL